MLPRDLRARLVQDGYAGPGTEADRQGLQMRVLREAKACRYVPGPDDVCLSIHSRAASAPVLRPGWVEVLTVACDDTGRYAEAVPGAQTLIAQEAAAIVGSVRRHLGRRRLVIHCAAGVSRPRSVASALADVFGLPYRWTVFNTDVVAAIRAAAGDVAT